MPFGSLPGVDPGKNRGVSPRRVIPVVVVALLLIVALIAAIDSPRVQVHALAASALGRDPMPRGHRATASARAARQLASGRWHSVVGQHRYLDIFWYPGATVPRYKVETRNPWDQPLRFLVTRSAEDARGHLWLRVLLGVEPNGSWGWVRMNGVRIVPDRDRIVVDMSTRVLQQYHQGRLVHRFQIAIGSDATPTTPGLFFVWAKVPAVPTGPYGSYVLGLSGFSTVLTSWPGGGRMAIHGTDDPSERGRPVSHGCVRVYNPQMDQLRDVPMGTPVLITR